MKIMIARRLVTSLALLALVSNLSVFARPSTDPVSAPEGQAFTLISLRHEIEGSLTRLMVDSSVPPLYTVFRPTGRLLIVDLPGGEGSQLAPEYQVQSALVGSVSVRRSRTGGGSGRVITRLEIGLKEPTRDRSRVEGNTLVIELAPDITAAATADQPAKAGVVVKPIPVSVRTPASDHAQPLRSVKAASLVSSVRQEKSGAGLNVVIEADGAIQFKDFVLADPWRIVVDIKGVRSAFGNKSVPVGAGSVERVRVGQPSTDVVRVVVDTNAKVPYRVTPDGSRLVVSVGSDAKAVETHAQNPAVGAASSNQQNTQAAKQTEAKEVSQRVEKAESSKPESTSTLVAQAARKSASESQSSSGQRVGAQPNRSLPLPNKPATEPAASPRETIVQPATPSSYSRTVMDVQKPASGPAQTSRARREASYCESGFVGGLISFDLRAGVDIRDMLRFVSQQYGINFIVDKSVSQVPVDIRVTDVPWNQVMESVLRANRLGAVCENGGRMIRIATLTAIKEEQEQQRQLKEEQAKLVPLVTKIIHLKYARAVGALGSTGQGSSGRSNSGGGGGGGGQGGGSGQGTFIGIIHSRLSPRGRIEMEARSNTLVVTDLPEYVEAVSEMVDQLDRPEPQVEIEARIVIASRNFLRDIGTELAGAAINNNRGAAGLLATSPVQFVPGAGLQPGGPQAGGSGSSGSGSSGSSGGSGTQKGLGPNLLGPFPTNALQSAVANTVLSLTTGAIGTGLLSMALSASETKGQIRTIASPRVTATNNKTAEIVNGVQIPVQTVSNNTITTTFVTAALRLEITPQIVEETGEVLMHIVAENNTVNFSLANQFNNGTPGINTQSAESIVRIQDGGTTVMGGINIDSEGQTQNRTPGISRLPLVGELFKRRTTRRDFDEILFFVTPRIVQPDGTVGPNMGSQRSSNEGRYLPSPKPAPASSGAEAKVVNPIDSATAQPNVAVKKGGQ
jgi:type IV pilus assembly protein PilQ